ncbi:MAG: nitrate- and nitrite sensing domain-containing protein, partial [Acidimicrobiales bacterium]
MSFRLKMALVTAPSLLVILALVWAVAAPRLDRANRARGDEDQAAVALASMRYLDELQTERALTVRYAVSRALSEKAELDAQRPTTDSLRVMFERALERETGAGLSAEEREAALKAASTLEQVRSAPDDAEQSSIYFAGRINSLLALNGRLGTSSTEASLVRSAASIYNFTLAKEQLSAMWSYVSQRLEAGTLKTSDYAQVAAFRAAADELLDNFEANVGAELGKAYQDARRSDAAREADGYVTALVDAGVRADAAGPAQPVPPGAWFAAMRGKLDALDAVEDVAFVDYAANAGRVEQSARNSAIAWGVLSLLAGAASIAATVVLGRSLARRLERVADQAKDIAGQRLPDVLDALRNPTPEALAGALPQVQADSGDEVGVLADSFNTVLRTSVETAMEHAQRRAQTMTNMLVNLGRRNQALIDRQLELIDDLEAGERDPALLEGMFQIDHLATRMRRNAENLLVLASEQPPRPWSESVPVLDVLRGAASEVQAMNRVTIETAGGDSSRVAGRFAVDLSHLLAELVENAAAFSPPTTPVVVRAERTGRNLRVWVIDQGLGMTDAEIEEANARLADPPDIDHLTADRVGFQVVGRIARRLEAAVRLQSNPGGGLAASVLLPLTVLDLD